MGAVPVDWSVNCTNNGEPPCVTSDVNCAFGATPPDTVGTGVGVTVGVTVGLTPEKSLDITGFDLTVAARSIGHGEFYRIVPCSRIGMGRAFCRVLHYPVIIDIPCIGAGTC